MKNSEKSWQTAQIERKREMKKLMTEWRKFLKENEMPQKVDTGIPAQVYYGLSLKELPSVRDNGIVNLPSDQEIEADRVGVPTCNSPHDAKKFGNVVLELNGGYLQDCGQYESSPNSLGNRIRMRDSASLSGSGVDKMVDNLGTNIPFDAVSRIIFTGTPNLDKLKESGFGSVEISSFPMGTDEELQTLHKPGE